VFDVDPFAHGDFVQLRSQLRAPYGILAQLLGPPSTDVPEKTSTIWSLRAHDDGQVVDLKDWQDEDDPPNVNVFRSLPSYDWSVHAESDVVAKRFCEWLSARVIAKASAVKTLSAEARVELNAMLAAGVPMGDAMKRVKFASPADVAARFAWPIAR
jgi:hypothetical protein